MRPIILCLAPQSPSRSKTGSPSSLAIVPGARRTQKLCWMGSLPDWERKTPIREIGQSAPAPQFKLHHYPPFVPLDIGPRAHETKPITRKASTGSRWFFVGCERQGQYVRIHWASNYGVFAYPHASAGPPMAIAAVGGHSELDPGFGPLHTQGANYQPAGDFFAETYMIEHLKEKMKFNIRPQRSANLRVLKAAGVPAVLIELGYLSNTEDEKLLTSPEWRAATAAALAAAVNDFMSDRQARIPL